MLEEASQSCNQWTQLSESVEQRVTGLHDSIEVLRVTALAERQKGEASKPVLVVLERSLADLQAQLAGEKKSHQLTQVLSPSPNQGLSFLAVHIGGNKFKWLKTSQRQEKQHCFLSLCCLASIFLLFVLFFLASSSASYLAILQLSGNLHLCCCRRQWPGRHRPMPRT